MASESSGRRSVRLPPDQQKELEKDGRIKRFFCDVLRLRVLSYITAQPASCVFILSLFLIAACMPPISWYIKNHDELPDLYTMKIWNSYLGKLAEASFCIDKTDAPKTPEPSVHLDICSNETVPSSYETVGVTLDFVVVDSAILADSAKGNIVDLMAQLKGKDLKTQIRDHNNSTERLDSDVTIHIHLQVDTKACNHTCHVNGCVSITAPLDAQPVRMPYIPEDYTFGTAMFNSDARHPTRCNCSTFTPVPDKDVKQLSHECKEPIVVKPAGEKFRRHGLSVVWLKPGDREIASFRIMIAALAVAAIGIAFAMAIACTDRPTQPKSSTELSYCFYT